LWRGIAETTVTGLPGHILNFFYKAVAPLSEDAEYSNYDELTVKYNEETEEKKSSDTIRKWVKHLCDIGWLTKEKSPVDKKRVIVKVIKNPKNSGEYRIPPFPEFFKEEDFKTWLVDVQTTTENQQLLLKENFLSDQPSSPKEIAKKFFLYKLPCSSDINLDDSKAEAKAKPEKKREKSGIQRSPLFPKTSTPKKGDHKSNVKVVLLKEPYEGTCTLCEQRRVLYHQIETANGEWGHVCQDCGDSAKGKMQR